MVSPTTFEQIDLMDLSVFTSGRQYEMFARLRAHDGIHWNEEPHGPGFWSVVRYNDVKAVMMDQPRLSNAEGTLLQSRRAEGKLHSLHNMDDPRHAQLRKVAAPYMRGIRVQSWQQMIQDAIDGLLDEAEADERIDVVRDIAARLPMLVLGRVLGVPSQDCPLMVDWTNKLTTDDPEYLPDPAMRDQARDELIAYFRDLTERRRAEPGDDLTSVLAAGRIDGELLGWPDLAAYYVLLVAAGNETTRHLISGGIEALNAHPASWEALHAEPQLVSSAVEEMVRWVSPVTNIRRTAQEDLELFGRTVRAGEKVVAWFAGANRDETVFEDPETFRIDRSPNPHLGFGWGIHSCMGSHLARVETTALFAEIIRRGLTIRSEGEPVGVESNSFTGLKRLPAVVVRNR
ncbi:cytochrome P450 [Nocardia jiangxiensis]|uniref:Cytochrome P450 n=1 Tax=Nocardia jiangxiensis TaxID=282685 RepID=A0ABW6SBV8_9NOCA